MGIGEIFKDANAYLTSDKLIPVTLLRDNPEKAKALPWMNEITWEEVEQGLEYLQKDVNDFYFTGNLVNPICYFKDLVFVTIPSFEIEIMKMMKTKEAIEHISEDIYKWIANKEFKKLFLLIDNKIAFYAYQELFEQIPDNEKFEIFIDIYTDQEYGFGELDKDFVRKVFKYRPEIDKEELIKEIGTVDENGFITIYRGQGEGSTPYYEAFSWTTKFKTALYFASRFDLNGEVYKARVYIDDVVQYYTGRNEFEIIVDPVNVIDVEELELMVAEEGIVLLQSSKMIDIYHKNIWELKERYFHNYKSIHGLKHAKRVTLYSLLLSVLEGLDKKEIGILVKASMYHDIGREHDGEDKTHGFESIKKMEKLRLFKNNKNQQNQILKYIIENHCIEDSEAFENVNNYKIADKEKAVYLLKVFKDADGLDRVRLGDLDVDYLRLESSKKLPLLAKHFLKGVE